MAERWKFSSFCVWGLFAYVMRRGQVPGQAYTTSVAGDTAVAFTANYAFGFKNTILTGHLNGDHMIADDFNVFQDGSGRSPYFTEGTFKKA